VDVEKKRTFWVFAEMRQRCLNPKHRQYRDYGGRGITVSDEWSTFSAFIADMGPRPDGFCIERINNDLGYFKENCKWASRGENNLNKRRYKNSPLGISGVERRDGKFRVRVRRGGKIVLSRMVEDFFEACCIVKSF
jgi:hypothetical protein